MGCYHRIMTLDESGTEVAEEQIVQTVLHRGVRTVGAKLHFESIVLSYGMKQLTVFIDDAKATIDTKIENVGQEDDAKTHETNILYRAAKLFMQQAMNGRRGKYRYNFVTQNRFLKDWARGPGNDVFHWTHPNGQPHGKDNYHSFETVFTPEHYEPGQKID